MIGTEKAPNSPFPVAHAMPDNKPQSDHLSIVRHSYHVCHNYVGKSLQLSVLLLAHVTVNVRAKHVQQLAELFFRTRETVVIEKQARHPLQTNNEQTGYGFGAGPADC